MTHSTTTWKHMPRKQAKRHGYVYATIIGLPVAMVMACTLSLFH